MKRTGQILFLALLFGACSSTENKDGEEATTDTAMESSTEDSLFAEDAGAEEGEEENAQPQEDLFVSSDEESGGGDNTISVNSSSGEYVVESGDTLMLIAFKVYGDYSKWKAIAGMNPGVSSGKLTRGQVLKFSPPAEKFVWNPKGEAYLIKGGDTLGTISNEKYGTSSKWKILFENNRPMIKDPNLIFAGFTLYYQADGREVASSL
jgi:nucleoid-associated protein YgaU